MTPGDVTATILAFGTVSSAVGAAVGGPVETAGLGEGMNSGRGGGRRLRPGPWVVALVFLSLPAATSGPLDVMAQEVPSGPNGSTGPAVSVDDFAWLTGEWEGTGPSGAVAQIDYMSPSRGVLPAVFRLLDDDRVVVLEMATLVEEHDGLVMYVRHFDPALVPLEEERAIRLRLVERDGDTYHFRNTNEGQNPVRSTLTRTETGFVSRSILARPDGSMAEIRVAYHRRD